MEEFIKAIIEITKYGFIGASLIVGLAYFFIAKKAKINPIKIYIPFYGEYYFCNKFTNKTFSIIKPIITLLFIVSMFIKGSFVVGLIFVLSSFAFIVLRYYLYYRIFKAFNSSIAFTIAGLIFNFVFIPIIALNRKMEFDEERLKKQKISDNILSSVQEEQRKYAENGYKLFSIFLALYYIIFLHLPFTTVSFLTLDAYIDTRITIYLILSVIIIAGLIYVSFSKINKPSWYKYALFFVFILFTILGVKTYSLGALIFILIPICLGVIYFDKKFTLNTSVASILIIICWNVVSVLLGNLELSLRTSSGAILLNDSNMFNELFNYIKANRNLYDFFNLLSTLAPNLILINIVSMAIIAGAAFAQKVMISQAIIVEKEAEAKLQLADDKLNIMVSQIQPHFMFNALNSISQLIKTSPSLAEKTLVDFGDYLRVNMESLSRKEPVLFNDELEYVKTYVQLEKLRFKERLRVVYYINATNFKIPALTVQPLVENAIKHGVCKKAEGGTVTITTDEYTDSFHITIADDGVGFDVDHMYDDKGRKHIGIENTRNRLFQTVKGEINISSKVGVGTTVEVIIPKIMED